MINQTKICSKCGAEKPVSEFYKNKSNKDGFSCQCVECQKIHFKKYYDKNRDILLMKAKQYHKENPEILRKASKRYREKNYNKTLEAGRLYAKNNKDKISKKSKKYYKENTHKLIAKARKYYKDNPDKVKGMNQFKIKNLTDTYIIDKLCAHSELTPDIIKQYPELIELQRIKIKIYRELLNH